MILDILCIVTGLGRSVHLAACVISQLQRREFAAGRNCLQHHHHSSSAVLLLREKRHGTAMHKVHVIAQERTHIYLGHSCQEAACDFDLNTETLHVLQRLQACISKLLWKGGPTSIRQKDTAAGASHPPSAVLTLHGSILAPLLSDVEPQWLPALMVICRHRSLKRDSNSIPTCTSSAYHTSARYEASERRGMFRHSLLILLLCTNRSTCGRHCSSVTQKMRSWLQCGNREQALPSTQDACMQQEEHSCHLS
jgi:hypothetical protein